MISTGTYNVPSGSYGFRDVSGPEGRKDVVTHPQVIMSTACVSGDLGEAFDVAKKQGVAVEVMAAHLDELALTGSPVPAVSVHLNRSKYSLSSGDAKVLESSYRELKREIDIAAGAGIHMAVIHPEGTYTDAPAEERLRNIVSNLGKLIKYAEKKEVTLLLENMPPGKFDGTPQWMAARTDYKIGERPEDLRHILGRIDSPNLKINLDLNHLQQSLDCYPDLKIADFTGLPHVVYCHVNDAEPNPEKARGPHVHHPPGTPRVRGILEELSRKEGMRYLSLEQGKDWQETIPASIALIEDTVSPETAPFHADSLQVKDPLAGTALKVAGRLLKERGLDDPHHVLLKRNIATYLVNAFPGTELAEISKNSVTNSSQILAQVLSSRWREKLERDLMNPYSDTDVLEHVRQLDGELKEKLRFILEQTGRPPLKVYINGSFAKGRLGANSDLDTVVELRDENVLAALKHDFAEKKKTGREDGVMMVALRPQDRFLRTFNEALAGASLDLGDGKRALEEDGFLLNKYLDILEEKKCSVQRTPEGEWRISTSGIETKRETANEHVNEFIRFFHQNKKTLGAFDYRKTIATMLGGVLLCPGFGRLAGAITDRLIPS
ncbi:MAG: TIM barrel protein [Armatimonadetes bacterium]|nr:TIM barrel protein [Armatimonadota bacterium]